MGHFGSMTVELHAVVHSTSSTIVVPTTVLDEDLLVLLQTASTQSSFPPAVTPTGFTNLSSRTLNGNDEGRGMLDYKFADGTEAGDTLTGIVGDRGHDSKLLAVFRKNPAAVWGTPRGTVSAALSNGPISLVGTTGPGLAVAFYSGRGVVTNQTGTLVDNGESLIAIDGTLRVCGAYEIMPQDQLSRDYSGVGGGTDWRYIVGCYFPYTL